MNPSEEPFHQPASLVAPKALSILCVFLAVRSMARDHFTALLTQFLVELVAIVGLVVMNGVI